MPKTDSFGDDRFMHQHIHPLNSELLEIYLKRSELKELTNLLLYSDDETICEIRREALAAVKLVSGDSHERLMEKKRKELTEELLRSKGYFKK